MIQTKDVKFRKRKTGGCTKINHESTKSTVDGKAYTNSTKICTIVTIGLKFQIRIYKFIQITFDLAWCSDFTWVVVVVFPNEKVLAGFEVEVLPNSPPLVLVLVLPNKPPVVLLLVFPNSPPLAGLLKRMFYHTDDRLFLYLVFPNKPPEVLVFPKRPPLVVLLVVLPNKPPVVPAACCCGWAACCCWLWIWARARTFKFDNSANGDGPTSAFSDVGVKL